MMINKKNIMNSDYINAVLVNGFNEKLKLILKDICDKNAELRYDVLLDNYTISSIELDGLFSQKERKKRKKNKILEHHHLCMAKKADGFQCTRRKKDGSEFCGKHMNNLKFGRVDDEIKYQDTDKYIKTRHEKINGTDYLIDNHNIVYSFDKSNPTIIGTYLNGNVVFKEDILT